MTDKPKTSNEVYADFIKRRDDARAKINAIDKDVLHDEPERQTFFNAVYAQARGDAAFVPWADLKPKDKLEQWLAENSGFKSSSGLTAIDVACGLGDNAEALADAGYKTSAFDLAEDAVQWARQRFPDTSVNYQQADLFNLPKEWIGAFDLVHECYTLQALPPQMLEKSSAAIASMVKPGGTLLVFTRTRENGTDADGPPWPLEQCNLFMASNLDFELLSDIRFETERNLRKIPHAFMEWRKSAS